MSVNVLIFTDCAHWVFTRYAGAYKIATVLRENGYTVQVVDHFLLAGLSRTLDIIDKFVGPNTLFVGFSTTFMNPTSNHTSLSKIDPNMFRFEDLTNINLGTSTVQGFSEGLPISHKEIDIIKSRIHGINSKTKLVMGGTKADFQNQPHMDAFVIGFADKVIVDYARYLEGKNPFFQYTPLGNGQIALDKDTKASSYDFVNSKIRFEKSDNIFKNEVLPIEVSRGCMFKCKFCYYPLIGRKKNDYTKNTDILYDEFMYNYENFGTTRYFLSDDTYNESLDKLEYLRKVYEKLPFKLEYCTYLRLDLIHRFPEMADLLKDSGLKIAMFGIETLNHEAGKCIGKGLHPEKSTDTLRWLRDEKGWKNNILMSSGFIVGLPNDTRDTISTWAETLLSGDYPLDSFNFHALRLAPENSRLWKSEFEKNYSDYGYYFDPSQSSGWINEHWRFEDAVDLANSIYRFAIDAGHTKLHGYIAMMLMNYGMSWSDMLNLGHADIDNNHIFNQTVEMSNDYFKKVLHDI